MYKMRLKYMLNRNWRPESPQAILKQTGADPVGMNPFVLLNIGEPYGITFGKVVKGAPLYHL